MSKKSLCPQEQQIELVLSCSPISLHLVSEQILLSVHVCIDSIDVISINIRYCQRVLQDTLVPIQLLTFKTINNGLHMHKEGRN